MKMPMQGDDSRIESRFDINGYTFEVIPSTNGGFHVRYWCEDEAYFLRQPSGKVYETDSHAYEAILAFLQETK